MDDIAELEDIGEQFRFLLQPVRDLAKNWDIDIKHYLEDYLNKLAQEHDNELDARGKRKIFNFAEAAVVIDGSTNIYSRKVDYLLQQAQNCLTEISVSNDKKKRRRVLNENGENVDDANQEDGAVGSDGEEMLEDPDELRRRKNIYLKPLTAELEEQMRNQFNKLAKKRPCFPVVPLAFTPLMDFEKCDVILYHRSVEKKALEVIGKKDDFKANTCQIINGVALIDLKNLELQDMFTNEQSNSDNNNFDGMSSFATSTAGSIYDETESQKLTSVNWNSSLNTSVLPEHEDFSTSNFLMSNNSNSCINSTAANDALPSSNRDEQSCSSTAPSLERLTQPLPAQTHIFSESQDSNFSLSNGAFNDAGSFEGQGAHDFNEALPLCSGVFNIRPNRKNADESFKPLDPTEELFLKSKPFQLDRRCTTDVSKQVEQRNKRIAQECTKKGIQNILTVKNFIDARIFGQKIQKKSHVFAPFNSFLMDRALLALNVECHVEEGRRAALRKKRAEAAKLERRVSRHASQRTTLDAAAHKDSVARASNPFSEAMHSPPRYEDPIEELGVDDIVDYGCGMEDHLNGSEADRPLGDLLNVEDLGEQSFLGYEFEEEDLNRSRRRSSFIRNDNIYDDTIYAGPSVEYPDELPPRPLSQMEYNDLVEYHLKKYWTIKEETTTKFAERVRNWEVKVKPLLDKELDHEKFDTRIYSTQLIESFSAGIGSVIDFLQFAQKAARRENGSYNLSRYLLVSLILTNMQNVEIINTEVNRLQLRLRKLERHDQVFDDEQRLITGGAE